MSKRGHAANWERPGLLITQGATWITQWASFTAARSHRVRPRDLPLPGPDCASTQIRGAVGTTSICHTLLLHPGSSCLHPVVPGEETGHSAASSAVGLWEGPCRAWGTQRSSRTSASSTERPETRRDPASTPAALTDPASADDPHQDLADTRLLPSPCIHAHTPESCTPGRRHLHRP